MKKILVAGCGHGGIVSAAILSKNGFDVTVIEQKKQSDLGYDWMDVFDINCLEGTGIKIPKGISLGVKKEMFLYPTNLLKSINFDFLSNDQEVKLERKDLYNILIKHAKKNGVKFIYNEKIVSSICNDNRVIGIKTVKKDYYADLIIDSAGVNSPIRNTLPSKFDIEKDIFVNDKFYVYRAMYSKNGEYMSKKKYKVYLMPHNTKGISWICHENKYIDVLIGKFSYIDENIIGKELNWLKKYNKIGNDVLRGGEITEIPVRRPLAKLVYNGYALVGDSACMTIPLIGSGISLSINASKILANVIIKNKQSTFDIEDLWEYQTIFFKNYGYDLASKDLLKQFLLNLEYKDINFLFESGFISNDILSKSTHGIELKFSLKEIFNFILIGIRKPLLLFKVIKVLVSCNKISKHCKNIITNFSEKEFIKWKNKYMSKQ